MRHARYWRLSYAPKARSPHRRGRPRGDPRRPAGGDPAAHAQRRSAGRVPLRWRRLDRGGSRDVDAVERHGQDLLRRVRRRPLRRDGRTRARSPSCSATDHTELRLEPDAVEVLPTLVWHYGEPFADESAIPSLYLAEAARRHVTVALNGDGGDESFAGYDHYFTRAWSRSACGGCRPGGAERWSGEPGARRRPAALRRGAARAMAGRGGDPLRGRSQRVRLRARFDEARARGALHRRVRSRARPARSRCRRSDGHRRCRRGARMRRRRSSASSRPTCTPSCRRICWSRWTSRRWRTRSRSDRRCSTTSSWSWRRACPVELKRRGRRLEDRPQGRAPAMGAGPHPRPAEDGLRRPARGVVSGPAAEAAERGSARSIARSDRGHVPASRRSEALIDDHLAGRADNSRKLWALLQLELWFRSYVDPPVADPRPSASPETRGRGSMVSPT